MGSGDPLQATLPFASLQKTLFRGEAKGMHPWLLVVVVVVMGSSLTRSGSLANGKGIWEAIGLLTPFVGIWGIQVLPAGN